MPKAKRKSPWRKWMEPYRDLIANTGGNPIEELLEDTDTHYGNNAIRAALIVCVDSQVTLLHRLKHAGFLAGPGAKGGGEGE